MISDFFGRRYIWRISNTLNSIHISRQIANKHTAITSSTLFSCCEIWKQIQVSVTYLKTKKQVLKKKEKYMIVQVQMFTCMYACMHSPTNLLLQREFGGTALVLVGFVASLPQQHLAGLQGCRADLLLCLGHV